jgi:Xaa-Pro dipeptidase
MNRRKFIKTSGAVATLATVAPAIALGQSSPQQINPLLVKAMRDRIIPITKDEHLQRMEQARKLMFENKLDAIFMEGGTSLNYFTGTSWGRSERLFGMLLFQTGEPVYIAPKFEEGRAKEQAVDTKILTWDEHENPYAHLKKIMSERNLLTGTLGIEETTRYFVTENLGKTISSLNIQSATPVTAGCRSIKSRHEMDLMQVANDITAEVYKAAVVRLKEGMGEREFGNIISGLFAEFGTDGGALVLFGEASAYPHGLLKESKLKQGDIVLIDGGCSVENYESDITRTTVFGNPTDKMKSVWSVVRKAQDAGLKSAKPGVPAEDVDAAARKAIADGGYGMGYKYFTHRLGHGIGMDGHEWHYLVGGNKRLLQAGNVFSNEPGIYIPGEFGIRIEDEMLITENGAKLLLPQQESLEKIF